MAAAGGGYATSAARELLVVFALAALGLLLAALVALAPWYPAAAGTGPAPVVRVESPGGLNSG